MLYDLTFLDPGQTFPPESESDRLKAYNENENLRYGEFEKVWPDLKEYLRHGVESKNFEFVLDYPNLITTKTSDLIIGEPPAFCLPAIENDTGKERNPQEQIVSSLLERCEFNETLDELISNLDSLGDGVLKLTRDAEGAVKILSVCPEHWFPIVKRGTDEILYHVLAFKYKDGDNSFLEVEIHSKEFIEHRLYTLNEGINFKASNIGQRLVWQNPDVNEIEPNPLKDFLVFTCHQKKKKCFGQSSYTKSLKYILKKLIIRYASENDILDTFSRPTFFGPSDITDIDPITKKPVFRPGGYISMNLDPGVHPIVPAALTWDAHLGENNVAIQSLLDRLFDVSEMSPVLFCSSSGRMGNANTAESGTALRLRLTNTLAKCNRIKRKIDGTAKRVINAALVLEGNVVEGLYIEWGSSLPRIPLEEAQRFQLLGMTPQFAGEVGGQFLLKELGYSEKEAAAIMLDSSRNSGMGAGM